MKFKYTFPNWLNYSCFMIILVKQTVVMIPKIPAGFLVECFRENRYKIAENTIGCHIFFPLPLPPSRWEVHFLWQGYVEHFLHVTSNIQLNLND